MRSRQAAPDKPINKPRDTKKVLIKLWMYLYRYKLLILLALSLTLAANSLNLLGPFLSGRAIDAMRLGKGAVNFELVFYYCGLMLLFFVLSSGLSYLLSILMINISQKIVHRMREDVFDKLSDLPVGYFDTHQTGDILSKITYDIDTINTSLSQDIIQIFTSIITVFGSLAMMIVIAPSLVTVFAVTIPISIYFTRFMSNKVRPLFSKRSRKLGELNGFVEEIVSGQKVVKVYNQEETMIERFDDKNNQAVEAFYDAEFYSSTVGPSVNFINNLSLSLVSIFGALLYLGGSLSIGNVSSFVLYSRRFSGPINELANILSELQSSLAAAERVFNVLDEQVEPHDVIDAYEFVNIEGNVSMDGVNFGYVENAPVIKNLNLKANTGSLVAIVGPTGAGKTTLINLLLRFYDPQSGFIEIDDRDITSATRKSLRLSYAMVLQDTWLFKGTVFENIAYGKQKASFEEVVNVAKAAKIHSFIESLPNGYDTILDEDGLNISKGQKQLLTIARAMLLDAKILILDEATSNVDTITEQSIQEAMRNLMKDKTCFVIAHRLSTIRNADMILVVKDGEIIEQGTHDSLIEKRGFYNELYISQFA